MDKPNIMLIDKPTGITSFDVIRIIRKKLGVKKMGHGGTLDPEASGLLIVGIGEGTKRLQDFLGMPKTYEATMRLGASTDTGDAVGEVVETKILERPPKKEEIETAVRSLEGEPELRVPTYSAVKRDGEPLYKKARRGEAVEAPVKVMRVYDIEVGEIEQASGVVDVKLIMNVGSGAYVRSIVEELGRRLGYPAHTSRIRRTKIGEYDVRDAEQLLREDINEFLRRK